VRNWRMRRETTLAGRTTNMFRLYNKDVVIDSWQSIAVMAPSGLEGDV